MLHVLRHKLANDFILCPDEYVHCFKTVSKNWHCLLRGKQCKNWSNDIVEEFIVCVIVVEHLLYIFNDHADCVEAVCNESSIVTFKVICQVLKKVTPTIYSASHNDCRHYTLDRFPHDW